MTSTLVSSSSGHSLTQSLLLLVGLVFLCTGCAAEDNYMDSLANDIHSIVATYDSATVSVSIVDSAHNRQLHVDGDRLFHAASTMKIPVMIELFRQAELGRRKRDVPA